MTNRDLVQNVATQLRELGYPLVETDVAVDPNRSGLRADVLAWGVNDGLRPEVLVEVKSGKAALHPDVLEQLSRLAMQSGAVQAFVFDGATWLRANKTFTDLDPDAGPSRHPIVETPISLPRRISDELASRAVWAAANDVRGVTTDYVTFVERALRHLEEATPATAGMPSVWSLINALTKVLGRRTEFGIREDVGTVMADLLAVEDGDLVLDPFCGIGGCLWATLEKADADGLAISVVGIDIAESAVDIAKTLAGGTDLDISFQVADSLRSELPPADRVITVPPWGLRIAEPVPLQMGGATKDGDAATLDRALSALRPGGRLVAHVSRGFLRRERPDVQRFRQWVAESYAVAGVIGLPGGLGTGTSFPSAFLVIDNAPATASTLVADLHDWVEQLKPDGGIVRTLKARKR